MGHLVGFDHISASCGQLEAGKKALLPLSYKAKFSEPDLPVASEKAPYMRTGCVTHSLSLMTPDKGCAVELIRHHDTLATQQGPYLAVSGTPLAGHSSQDHISDSLAQAGGIPFVKTMLNGGLTCYAPMTCDAPEPGINTIVLPCNHLQTSAEFWTHGMGFTEISRGHDWQQLEFKAIFATLGLRLLLVETPDALPGTRYIDDSGWTSLAFLTKNVHKSTSHLINIGAKEVGHPFPLTVNGADLTLLFFRGPDNELIELIEVRRR